jgi:hypothetical protein
MAKQEVLRFFEMLLNNQQEKERLYSRNLPELLFQAEVMGYQFDAQELTSVVGGMEWVIITEHDKEQLDAYSSLWKRMWGLMRLEYIHDELYSKLTNEELDNIISN